jgi:hypothetical protein
MICFYFPSARAHRRVHRRVERNTDDLPSRHDNRDDLAARADALGYGIIPTSLTHHSRSGEQFRQPDTPCALS